MYNNSQNYDKLKVNIVFGYFNCQSLIRLSIY
jgi:hypothetical protein